MTKHIQSGECNEIMNKLWGILESKNSLGLIVGLRALYKTHYSTFGGHMSIDNSEPLPIRYK